MDTYVYSREAVTWYDIVHLIFVYLGRIIRSHEAVDCGTTCQVDKNKNECASTTQQCYCCYFVFVTLTSDRFPICWGSPLVVR